MPLWIRFALAGLVLGCSSTPTPPIGPPDPIDTPPDGDDPQPPVELTPEQRMVRDLADLRWSALGNPVIRWDSIPAVTAPKEAPHRLLVVLVEFADYRFERFRGERDQAAKLVAYYQEQLFDGEYARRDTLSHYFADQSAGAYHVDGVVLPPVRLSKPRRAYGSPNRPAGGDWRTDGDIEAMVEEALALAAPTDKVPLADFDRWDPVDFDADGVTAEPDGYLDHFVVVYAGGAQNACQSLNKIDDVLTPNVGNEALAKLDKRQRECAERPWPHRSAIKLREAQGPAVGTGSHKRGGIPIGGADGAVGDRWVFDYNMQSEYTDNATFIHEFGHSIGLPDVYSRTSSNSTGSWEVMSSDISPSPQGMSAWSRIQLGWLKPTVIVPPQFGGAASGEVSLARLDDASARGSRAALVVLPPKKKLLELTETLPEGSTLALYGGQGNDLERSAAKTLDLSAASDAVIAFDAWWEIEAGWDFAYLEVSTDAGQSWKRQLPLEKGHMPAKHGHDGKDTVPGFTGLSGDLDGDGKNESSPSCDPAVAIKQGEDKAGALENPCLVPTWVRPSFSLKTFAGGADVRVRLRYYTDGAAVMRGILIDNVSLTVTSEGAAKTSVIGTFEGQDEGWTMGGFTPSPGKHELFVPHYYLLEYREPYAASGYDTALGRSSYAVYQNPADGEMVAVEFRRRPGVVVWYADGSYAWSENDPAINGPGKGYALVVDSNPNEIALPGLEKYFAGKPEAYDTHYDLSPDGSQKLLQDSFAKMVCFTRNRAYYPRDVKVRCGAKRPPLSTIRVEDKIATYSYEIADFLPGQRDTMLGVGEIIDTRSEKAETSYRLRDRALRYYHTFDAPFAATPFEDGIVIYRVAKGGLEKVDSQPYPATPSFDDANQARWLNPKLPFGGAAVPQTGFSFTVSGGEAPTVRYKFAR